METINVRPEVMRLTALLKERYPQYAPDFRALSSDRRGVDYEVALIVMRHLNQHHSDPDLKALISLFR